MQLRHPGHLWTDLAEIWCAFYHTLGQKSTNFSAKSVHRRTRKGVSDATSEGKIQRPKFKGPSLVFTSASSSMVSGSIFETSQRIFTAAGGMPVTLSFHVCQSTGWGGHLFRRFCKKFSKSSQAVGLYCSCHAAQASKGNFQKTCYETFGTSGRPTQYRTIQLP